ncbi:hypothetical protein C8C93_1501 [Acidovorax sp. 93]|nr:hypothetical protein C8C93_1501 [Acidovorax sp. 93]
MSALTLTNSTSYIAQYVIHRGGLALARLPGLAPGATLSVPEAETFEITARAPYWKATPIPPHR